MSLLSIASDNNVHDIASTLVVVYYILAVLLSASLYFSKRGVY